MKITFFLQSIERLFLASYRSVLNLYSLFLYISPSAQRDLKLIFIFTLQSEHNQGQWNLICVGELSLQPEQHHIFVIQKNIFFVLKSEHQKLALMETL